MITRDLTTHFERYVDAYNRSLGDAVNTEGIRAFFANCFVAAGPAGANCGQNDDSFTEMLNKGYAFYKSIGTQHLALRGVEMTPIDETHDMARICYRATNQKPDCSSFDIDFAVTYLLQIVDDEQTIFAFIAVDETARYRQHELLPTGDS